MAESTPFQSCIKVNGRCILPPILTDESRFEMRMYRKKAMDIEASLRLSRREQTLNRVHRVIMQINKRKGQLQILCSSSESDSDDVEELENITYDKADGRCTESIRSNISDSALGTTMDIVTSKDNSMVEYQIDLDKDVVSTSSESESQNGDGSSKSLTSTSNDTNQQTVVERDNRIHTVRDGDTDVKKSSLDDILDIDEETAVQHDVRDLSEASEHAEQSVSDDSSSDDDHTEDSHAEQQESTNDTACDTDITGLDTKDTRLDTGTFDDTLLSRVDLSGDEHSLNDTEDTQSLPSQPADNSFTTDTHVEETDTHPHIEDTSIQSDTHTHVYTDSTELAPYMVNTSSETLQMISELQSPAGTDDSPKDPTNNDSKPNSNTSTSKTNEDNRDTISGKSVVNRSYTVDHPSKHLTDMRDREHTTTNTPLNVFELTQSMEDLKIKTVQRKLSFEEISNEVSVTEKEQHFEHVPVSEKSPSKPPRTSSHVPVRLSHTSVVTTGNKPQEFSPQTISSPVRLLNMSVSTHNEIPPSSPYVVQRRVHSSDIDHQTDDLHNYLSSLSQMPAMQFTSPESANKADTSHLARTDMHSYSYVESPVCVNDRTTDSNSESPVVHYGPNNYQIATPLSGQKNIESHRHQSVVEHLENVAVQSGEIVPSASETAEHLTDESHNPNVQDGDLISFESCEQINHLTDHTNGQHEAHQSPISGQKSKLQLNPSGSQLSIDSNPISQPPHRAQLTSQPTTQPTIGNSPPSVSNPTHTHLSNPVTPTQLCQNAPLDLQTTLSSIPYTANVINPQVPVPAAHHIRPNSSIINHNAPNYSLAQPQHQRHDPSQLNYDLANLQNQSDNHQVPNYHLAQLPGLNHNQLQTEAQKLNPVQPQRLSYIAMPSQRPHPNMVQPHPNIVQPHVPLHNIVQPHVLNPNLLEQQMPSYSSFSMTSHSDLTLQSSHSDLSELEKQMLQFDQVRQQMLMDQQTQLALLMQEQQKQQQILFQEQLNSQQQHGGDTKFSPGRTDSRATMNGILELSLNEPVDLRITNTQYASPSKNDSMHNTSLHSQHSLQYADTSHVQSLHYDSLQSESSASRHNTSTSNIVPAQSTIPADLSVYNDSVHNTSNVTANQPMFHSATRLVYNVYDIQSHPPELHWKLCKLSAAVKGYLTRALMSSYKVQRMIGTIKDTAEFALKFQDDLSHKSIHSTQDYTLLDRVLTQLTGTMYEIHDVFFNWTVGQQMAAISKTRQYQVDSLHQNSTVSNNLVKKRVTNATLKAIERRKKAQEKHGAALSLNKTAPHIKKVPPRSSLLPKPNISLMNHSRSATSNVLRPIQKTSSPIKPIKDSLNRAEKNEMNAMNSKISPNVTMRRKTRIITNNVQNESSPPTQTGKKTSNTSVPWK